MENLFKDILKDFDDFKSKQKVYEVMFFDMQYKKWVEPQGLSL